MISSDLNFVFSLSIANRRLLSTVSMDNNLKRGPKPPRGNRGSVAMARRAQRLAGIKGIAFAQAQVAKAHAELDKRTSKVVMLETTVVRQSETLRAAAAKFREVRAQVSTARPLSALSRTHPRPRCAAPHTRLAQMLPPPL